MMHASLIGLATQNPTCIPEGVDTECDIFICCYNEPVSCILNTLEGALQQNIPHTVYICDDGRSYLLLEAICTRFSKCPLFTRDDSTGVYQHDAASGTGIESCFADKTHKLVVSIAPINIVYIARVKGQVHHAKAGNLNSALAVSATLSNRKFIAVLDADMRPLPNFASLLISTFYRPSSTTLRTNMAFCQSPQIFDNISPSDPFAHRNSVFFNSICPRRSYYKMAPFAGSNAVFQRSIISGITFQTDSITEDMLTGQVLHTAGYTSLYVNLPLCIGQSPSTLHDTIVQRMRWQMGSIQIFFKCNPLCSYWNLPTPGVQAKSCWKRFTRGLMYQIFYLNSTAYSLTSIATSIFSTIPVLVACTGQPLSNITSLKEIAYYFFPYLICARIMNFCTLNSSPSDLFREAQLSYWMSYTYVCGIFRVISGSLIEFAVTPKETIAIPRIETSLTPRNTPSALIAEEEGYRDHTGWLNRTHSLSSLSSIPVLVQDDPVEISHSLPPLVETSPYAYLAIMVFIANMLASGVLGVRYYWEDVDAYTVLGVVGLALHINMLLWPAVAYTWIQDIPNIQESTLIPTVLYYLSPLSILLVSSALIIWDAL